MEEVEDLFEGEDIDNILAEQAAILSEISQSKGDPPWLVSGPTKVGGITSSKGTSGSTVLQMTPAEPTFNLEQESDTPPEGFKVPAKVQSKAYAGGSLET